MRDADYKEFSAMLPVESRYQLVENLTFRYGFRDDTIVAKHGDEPVAIGGMLMARPNVVTLYFFATDKLPLIGKALTRWIRKELLPRTKEAGVHRIECISIEGHEEAHKWIRSLGLTQEAPPFRGYGKNGENFIQFAWVAP